VAHLPPPLHHTEIMFHDVPDSLKMHDAAVDNPVVLVHFLYCAEGHVPCCQRWPAHAGPTPLRRIYVYLKLRMSRLALGLLLVLGRSTADPWVPPFGVGSYLTISSYDAASCTGAGSPWGVFYVFGVSNAAACIGMVSGAFDGIGHPPVSQILKIDMGNTQNMFVYSSADKDCQTPNPSTSVYSDPESEVINALNNADVGYCHAYTGSNGVYQGKSFAVTTVSDQQSQGMSGGTSPPYFFNIPSTSSLLADGSICQSNGDCQSGQCHGGYGSACQGRRLFGAPTNNNNNNNQPDCTICTSSNRRRELGGKSQHHQSHQHHKG